MPEVSDAFVNQDRLAHHRRKILSGQQNIASSRPVGIRSTTGALFDLAKDLKVPFFKDVSMNPSCMVITMQTQSMEQVLEQNTSGLQSDTLEGAIHELDCDGEVCIHFTSCFDPICDRWVPVLVSLLFGKSKEHFVQHWKVFFECFDACQTWADFENSFWGVTMDWSDALGSAFLTCLCRFSQRFPDGNLTEANALSFLRKCGVHFRRSVKRCGKEQGCCQVG